MHSQVHLAEEAQEAGRSGSSRQQCVKIVKGLCAFLPNHRARENREPYFSLPHFLPSTLVAQGGAKGPVFSFQDAWLMRKTQGPLPASLTSTFLQGGTHEGEEPKVPELYCLAREESAGTFV